MKSIEPARPAALRLYDSWRGPAVIGLWTLHKGQLPLRCTLYTHALGWELKATVRDELMRSPMAS